MQINPKKKIIIIGAGIVGVMQAWYLAQTENVHVILLEKNSAGSGVSKDSFAWLNVSYGRPDAYQHLRSQAIAQWRALDIQTQGKLDINWSGAISWMSTTTQTAQFIEEHNQAGFNVQSLTAKQLQARVPELRNPPEIAAFAADEGAIDPLHVINTLLAQVQEMGVEYHSNTKVIKLLNKDNIIIGVETTQGEFYAETVVLTAGTGCLPLLLEQHVDLPLYSSPSILLYLSHSAKREPVPCIISTPDMELRSFGSNAIVAAEDYINGISPEQIAQQAKETFCHSFAETQTLTLEQVNVGQRPMPEDEMPIVGKVLPYQGLYIVVMHAAVTLSPLICALATQELIQHKESSLLKPYRLSRFNGSDFSRSNTQ